MRPMQCIVTLLSVSLVPSLAACGLGLDEPVVHSAGQASSSIASGSPEAAAHEDKVTFRVEPVQREPSAITALHLETGQQLVLVDPPPSCNLFNVGGEITGFYTNGQLTHTISNYRSEAVCAPTAAGQTMWNLWDQAAILVNSSERDWATPMSCVYPNETFTPCLNVWSEGSYTCDFGFLCAGNYSANHSTFMTLPPGWLFVDPLPSYCVRLAGEQIECTVETLPVFVPQTR